MNAGPVVTRGGGIEQNRAATLVGQTVVEAHIGFKVGAGLGELNKTLSPFLQHPAEGEHIFVGHGVGHHRGAVVVALDRHKAVTQTLGRESTAADIQRFVQNLAHGLFFFVGGRTSLGRLQPHGPDHDRGNRHESSGR